MSPTSASRAVLLPSDCATVAELAVPEPEPPQPMASGSAMATNASAAPCRNPKLTLPF